MKTTLFYGLAISFSVFLLNAILFFTGLQDTPEKLSVANNAAFFISIAAMVGFTVYGVRERRAEVPEEKDFTYGNAFVSAFLITLVSAVASVVVSWIVVTYLNPNLTEMNFKVQEMKMRQAGAPEANIAQAMEMSRKFMKPAVFAIFNLLGGIVFGAIISLITAAFLRRTGRPPVVPTA